MTTPSEVAVTSDATRSPAGRCARRRLLSIAEWDKLKLLRHTTRRCANDRSVPRLALALALLSLAAGAGCAARKAPGLTTLGTAEQLTIIDSLPSLLSALSAPDAGSVAGAQAALLAYEERHRPLLEAVGAPADPSPG